MAEKLNDSKLNKVVGGDEEGINYKYNVGDCFHAVRGLTGYYSIIELAGYLDKKSNSPVYKCGRFSPSSITQKNSTYSELFVDEKTLDSFERAKGIPSGL